MKLIGKNGREFPVEGWQAVLTTDLIGEYFGEKKLKNISQRGALAWCEKAATKARQLENMKTLEAYLLSEQKEA